MLKLPPPIWALVYVLTAAAISWLFGWSKVPGFPLVALGISLVAISWILPVWAIVLFRREGTEVEPTSATNRKLITSGPYQFTRNPMYLGLVVLTLGIAIWVGAWPMFGAPIALFATANWVHIPFEKQKCVASLGRYMTTTSRGCGAGYDCQLLRCMRPLLAQSRHPNPALVRLLLTQSGRLSRWAVGGSGLSVLAVGLYQGIRDNHQELILV
jgi:protein-S-isoprenylcysteine O-methyltransferase Ste14